MKYDAIVVGAGIAGLVASTEIAQSGKRVLLVEQEPQPERREWGGRLLQEERAG